MLRPPLKVPLGLGGGDCIVHAEDHAQKWPVHAPACHFLLGNAFHGQALLGGDSLRNLSACTTMELTGLSSLLILLVRVSSVCSAS